MPTEITKVYIVEGFFDYYDSSSSEILAVFNDVSMAESFSIDDSRCKEYDEVSITEFEVK